MTQPVKISVVVVCYNEITNIRECLQSLVCQDYPQSDYEILVIDNDSNDGTKDILAEYALQNNNMTWLVNQTRGIAGSRNRGIEKSKHDLIAFIDADCIAPKSWLKKYADAYERHVQKDPVLAGIGSGNKPPETTTFYKSLGIMLDTFLGSRGSVQGKALKKNTLVKHLPTVNVMYQKKMIQNAGGFDASLGNIGEDQDLSFRLNQRGLDLRYIPDNFVIHKMRSNIVDWCRNMFTYGKGRMILIKKYPSTFSPLFLLPLFLPLLYLTCPFSKHLLSLMIIYTGVVFAQSLYSAVAKKMPVLTFHVFILFLGTHFFYGMGEICGVFKKTRLDG
ncbi:MAG: glycosyltransferase [Deltaproteobacteria bacterium]|nr:glycosyltransferase [Deltaproteobacteria bacterium]